jgi:hypothetical protein
MNSMIQATKHIDKMASVCMWRNVESWQLIDVSEESTAAIFIVIAVKSPNLEQFLIIDYHKLVELLKKRLAF